MKLTHSLPASLFVGALLLSISACSPTQGQMDKPLSSASATTSPTNSPTANTSSSEAPTTISVAPTVTPTSAVPAVEDDAVTIAQTVNKYYAFISSADSFSKVKAAGSTLSVPPTDTELTQLAKNFPEGFKYFDTSTSQKIMNAHSQLFARATQSQRNPEATINVTTDAITVNGDTATIDSSKILVSLNGMTSPLTQAPYFEMAQTNLVKKADGTWVMIAEAPRQSIP